ncbi:MAG: hypothetical protein ACTS79_00015 [Arsenophonus sp. ET-KM2-MAG3]
MLSFAIPSSDIVNATMQINLLEAIASKTCLRISVQKTKCITNIQNAPKFLTTDIGRVERIRKFGYLGELIKENGLDKFAIEVRVHKMERAYGITKDVHNIKCLSKNLKIRHCTSW